MRIIIAVLAALGASWGCARLGYSGYVLPVFVGTFLFTLFAPLK
jgi:hypothetical protein